MEKWIQGFGQFNSDKQKQGKWKDWLLLVCVLAVMVYLLLFAGDTLMRELVPATAPDTKESQFWEQAECRIMELFFPVVVYGHYYGYDHENTYAGNPIPISFYQDEETTDAQETVLEAGAFGTEAAQQAPVSQVSGNPVIPGQRFTREQLSDFQFMIDHCYIVDSTTYVDREEMNADALLSMDMTMHQDNSDYQILIYHTHSSSETFVDSRPGVLEDTPVGLGDTLTVLLEQYGYKVYHDRTVYDQINGKIDRNYAYTASGEGIDRILAEHPSIEVVIELHRDGVNENTHLVTEINGKPTAKIMFFNGVSRTIRNGELEYLTNPNRQANLAFSLQMYLTGTASYDDFLRRNYIKGYQYNLDRRPKATLIEVGGQTNTLEEANNAMEPLADILNQVLSGRTATFGE